MSIDSEFQRIGHIINTPMEYDIELGEANEFLPHGTALYIRDPMAQSAAWVFCVNGLPNENDADPWGNIFVIQDAEEGPVTITVAELLEELESLDDQNMANLPVDKQFYWKRTGLTNPFKTSE